MGMGYSGNSIIEVTTEKLTEINPASFNRFIETLEKYQVSLDAFAIAITDEGDIMTKDTESGEGEEVLCESMSKDLDRAYLTFIRQFKEDTGVAIELFYHDGENKGDRYDDIDGATWALNFDDVYQMTPKAEALKNNLPFERQWFVEYG